MKKNSQSLDDEALADYMTQHVEGFQGPLTADKFPGGQSNPTFLLTAKSGQYVLRRKPPGTLLKSAHAVDREYKVLTALADTDVPVARGYHLCEDDAVIGSMFYVMEYLEGRVLWDPSLPDFSNEDRSQLYDEVIQVMAALHNVDVDKVGLADYGRPGNYFERQMSRWSKQYRAAETQTIDDMESLMDWLNANIPDDIDKPSLIHGDYRLDNLMMHPQDNKVIAVLDWELSTLGHPLADLAYFCMGLRLPTTALTHGLMGVDRKPLAIPSEEEIVQRYCQLRGIDEIDHWPFYLAFSFFRLASIAQGVYKRALDGNASNENALKTGDTVVGLAQLAMAVVRGEN